MKRFVEKFIEGQGLSNLLILCGMVVTVISFFVGLSFKEMGIEKEHQLIIDNQNHMESQILDIQKQLFDFLGK